MNLRQIIDKIKYVKKTSFVIRSTSFVLTLNKLMTLHFLN